MAKTQHKADQSGIGTKKACLEKFKEWWTTEELSAIVSRINPSVLSMFAVHGEKISNPDRLAEILYDSVGQRFLRNIENNTSKRQEFLNLILDTVIYKNIVTEKDVIDSIRCSMSGSRGDKIKSISDITSLNAMAGWCTQLAAKLGLPPSVAEKENAEPLPDTEIIEPHSPLNPLYDYQYSTGLYVRGMLEGNSINEKNRQVKRKLIAVPTGSGKTRMIVETIIEWLNDGKPSKNPQQRDSKFILWIAQSQELCEQALSTFRSVFESFGRRGTTLRIHRFWGTGGTLPTFEIDELLDDKGIIIATIQSLYKILKSQPEQIEQMGKITSCIIIDEAHHSVAESYSSMLRKMGFNWDNRKKEISEMGIILIGLTATPFRGAGGNIETARLARWYDGVHFPMISLSEDLENYKPHAIIDCQAFAYVNEHVRILGTRSYDRDGFIEEEGYSWRITGKAAGSKKKGSTKNEWTFEGAQNITFQFPKPGEYKITLEVTDNDGDCDTATALVEVREQVIETEVQPSQKQRHLYDKLIKRKILCDVQHKILQSTDIELDSKDAEHMQRFGEFRNERLRDIGRDPVRNKLIIDEIYKMKNLGRKKILFFGCSVDHSRNITMFLKTIYNMKVRYVDSKMDLDSRVNAIEQFRRGQLDVLCNFDVLTTGFDSPNVDCVFVGRPIKSTLLYTQMIGRGMRGTKSGGTEDVVIVDIDDNFQIHTRKDDPTMTTLGWKIFRDYWKPWQDPKEETELKEETAEEQSPDIAHSCSNCGDVAHGIESIKKMFGIEGPTQMLVEYLEAQNEAIPSECAKCRKT